MCTYTCVCVWKYIPITKILRSLFRVYNFIQLNRKFNDKSIVKKEARKKKEWTFNKQIFRHTCPFSIKSFRPNEVGVCKGSFRLETLTGNGPKTLYSRFRELYKTEYCHKNDCGNPCLVIKILYQIIVTLDII